MTKIQGARLRHVRQTLLDGAITDFEMLVGTLGEPMDSVVAKLAVDVRMLVNAEGGLSDSILKVEQDQERKFGKLGTK